MAKKTVNPKKSQLPHHRPQAQAPAKVSKPVLSERNLQYAMIAFLLLFVSFLYFPVAFGGKAPVAGDITQWQGAANKIIEYNQTHPDRALWTQSMFSGMPSYMISFPNRWPFLENLSRLSDKLINWRIFLLFIGGLGIFFLLRFLKMDVWTAFLGAIAFMFSCHWLGLVEIGHNTKFRAIMYIPWVIWALLYLRKKPGILGLGFLASMLIVQLRENHPQISYYLYLLVGMYWVWQMIECFRSKAWGKFILFTALMIAAFGLTLLAVMNPYLSTMEYSHFTMRGGSAGLETSYAQGWSFHPKEILSLIIPDFFGGINQTYWGYMPFTQIYNYFGIVVLALGIFALFGTKHRRLAIFLWISSVIFTLMSFGSATPALSDLFLNYLPYFNKFRVPSMILTMVQFNAVLLAALGVDTLLERNQAGDAKWGKSLFRIFWISGGVFLLWLILAKSVFSGMSFAHANELELMAQRGMTELPDDLKVPRLNALYRSGIFSLLFLTVSLGLAYLHSVKKLPRLAFLLLLVLIVFVDLFIYTSKHLRQVVPHRNQQERFRVQDFDQFLLQDDSNHRIYPIDKSVFSDTRMPRSAGEWAYHHQTVSGYSAAKLKRYDDLLKYLQGSETKPGEWSNYLIGLYNPGENAIPEERSTPIMDMLSVKYLVHPEALPHDSLLTKFTPAFTAYNGIRIYQNRDALDRAWFVNEVRTVTPADSILPLLGSQEFDPRQTAFVETKLTGIEAPDSTRVKQTKAELHSLAYELYTDKPAFLVLSEIWYPAGWKAFLDGKEIPIHAANYILRGLQIPAGEHKLELEFKPDSYRTSITLSLLGLLLSLLLLLAGLAFKYLPQGRQIPTL